MHISPRLLQIILLIQLGALIVTACQFDTEDTWRVRIATTDGTLPPSFVAHLWLPDGKRLRVECPSIQNSMDTLFCGNLGEVRIVRAPRGSRLTLKARGYVFETRTLADISHDFTWILMPLPTPETNNDYATGFNFEQGLDDFLSKGFASNTELGKAVVVKFYIDSLRENPVVYFQNTKRHPIHYNFVRDVLGKAISSTDFVQKTYQGEDRTAMAGSILYYPELTTQATTLGNNTNAPLIITFFPSDNLTPAQAALAHRLIEERLGFAQLAGSQLRTLYLPAGEIQENQANLQHADLDALDAAWITRAELYGGISMQLLNDGIAYGTLRRLTPEELEHTPVSFSDVLILSRLPNDLPVVGGTITEELQTPLAHVNVAARNRKTPNMALLHAGQDPRIQPLLGKLVRFEIQNGAFTIEETTFEEARNFWESRHLEPQIPESDLVFDELADFDTLSFADAPRVGVKAANLAELHHILPTATSTGFAVPFRYYHEFTLYAHVTTALCNQAYTSCTMSGRDPNACARAQNLCLQWAHTPINIDTYLRSMLENADFATDAVLRDAVLDGVRIFFVSNPLDTTLAARIDDRVLQIFGNAKVRLRSSTNAEDLPDFSGAGIYSSFSAYASGEKAASSVIRKTWASVWNRAAFEERAFWNVDHMAVKMGVAINIAFSNEAANGVLITQNIADPSVEGMYVNVQLGEISVTNPTGGALPEIFSILYGPGGNLQTAILRYSSLSPDAPILNNDQIRELHHTCDTAHTHFAQLYGKNPAAFALDIEFKLWGNPLQIYLKQARPYVVR